MIRQHFAKGMHQQLHTSFARCGCMKLVACLQGRCSAKEHLQASSDACSMGLPAACVLGCHWQGTLLRSLIQCLHKSLLQSIRNGVLWTVRMSDGWVCGAGGE